ncbi:MAG TPA: PhnD/SsuA/transferrin family substrate-binding protein [Acidimicrobiia bacterium]|nr:PhnD/SsuA/transferrin family substrate-binding protein [Acidimicrobiia bacterium]
MPALRFGTFLAPNMMSVYQAIAAEVGASLGVETELVVESDYENCRNDVNDVCFVCSLPYIHFEREGVAPAVPVAAPVLQGDRYAGRPIYFSDVIVHRDSEIQRFEDLRGRSWAYNEPLSQSGYGITRYHLVAMGETGGFFGEVIEAGFHETAIRMVRDREVDASAIDSQVLAIEMRDHPEIADTLRVIDALGPSTIQPVAVSKRWEPDFREAIRDVLTDLHRRPGFGEILDHGMIESFVEVGPESYDDIRQMLETCERAAFMVIR